MMTVIVTITIIYIVIKLRSIHNWEDIAVILEMNVEKLHKWRVISG